MLSILSVQENIPEVTSTQQLQKRNTAKKGSIPMIHLKEIKVKSANSRRETTQFLFYQQFLLNLF